MKHFLILGGLIGFLVALGGSWHAGNSPAYAVRDGSVGCLVGAFLFRGLHLVYFNAVRHRFAVRAAEIVNAQMEQMRPAPRKR